MALQQHFVDGRGYSAAILYTTTAAKNTQVGKTSYGQLLSELGEHIVGIVTNTDCGRKSLAESVEGVDPFMLGPAFNIVLHDP